MCLGHTLYCVSVELILQVHYLLEGAQWPSGGVLDLRRRGHRFELHWRHCVVVLEQDTLILA